MTEREELLDLISKLRAHAVSARSIGEPVEAASFEAKVQELMAKHGVTEEELGVTAAVETHAAVKTHCYRVLYATVQVNAVDKNQRSATERQRFVVATTEQAAGFAIAALHPDLEVQVQQVAVHAKDVVLAA